MNMNKKSYLLLFLILIIPILPVHADVISVEYNYDEVLGYKNRTFKPDKEATEKKAENYCIKKGGTIDSISYKFRKEEPINYEDLRRKIYKAKSDGTTKIDLKDNLKKGKFNLDVKCKLGKDALVLTYNIIYNTSSSGASLTTYGTPKYDTIKTDADKVCQDLGYKESSDLKYSIEGLTGTFNTFKLYVTKAEEEKTFNKKATVAVTCTNASGESTATEGSTSFTEKNYRGTSVGENICSQPEILNVLKIIGFIVLIAKIIIPFIVIILAMIKFLNLAVVKKDPDLKTPFIIMMKKIAIAILIFMVPSIVNALIGLTGETKLQESYLKCVQCVTDINKCN